MATFTGFLDNLANGALSPKGNLGDYAHASRLFVNENQRLAPKQKFLYHCFFELNGKAASVLPELQSKHNLEIGLLVKSAQLPQYTADVEVKNKYNRKKNVQTSIQYQPVEIIFHDDNYGVTTALLEAYYRYYFADGNHKFQQGAYSKTSPGDNTYRGPSLNTFKYGLDNDISVPFFKNIQISQMARKSYTTYTLVNPIITNWSHDQVDSSDGTSTMQNSITVAYEAVFYDRGNVVAGVNGSPTGFGAPDHYDVTPSALGTGGLGGILGTASDLFGFITNGTGFNNPLQAGLAAAGLIRNVRNLSSDGLRQEGFNLLKGAIGAAGGVDVSGVSNTFFPKNAGSGGSAKDLALGAAAVAGISALSSQLSNAQLKTNPAALASAKKQQFQKNFQAAGNAGGVNEAVDAFESLGSNDDAELESQVLGGTFT